MGMIVALRGPNDVSVHVELEDQDYHPDILTDLQNRAVKTFTDIICVLLALEDDSDEEQASE